ncbi:MAG: family 43 glycosylhydrolase [Solirubrobacteraceae bacterium]
MLGTPLGPAVCLVLLVVAVLSIPGGAGATSEHYANPLRSAATGGPLSCPDPSVIEARTGGWRYYMVCTSNYQRDAFPIRESQDLVHWKPAGYVFPAGHQPWWAVRPNGSYTGGRYWAPEIFRIQRHWVVYFAAQYNPDRVGLEIPGEGPVAPGTMVIGVARATSLSGPWHTSILHYRGQLNGVSQEPEHLGGSIDPSVVRDQRTRQLYLFWADQPTQIWAGKLSYDGLRLAPQVHQVLQAGRSWECDPATSCTVEGPEPFYHNGLFYLLYSGASTWDYTYGVGVATSADPMRDPFVKRPDPILRSGHGFVGPGHSSHPVQGPDRRTYILFHAQLYPSHTSANRLLMLDRFTWDGLHPRIGTGVPARGH